MAPHLAADAVLGDRAACPERSSDISARAAAANQSALPELHSEAPRANVCHDAEASYLDAAYANARGAGDPTEEAEDDAERASEASDVTNPALADDIEADQEDSLTLSKPRPREDVKCYLVEKADGQKAVVVERIDGKRWRFEQKHIDFELHCDAESLSSWLESITTQQMPGLLTLLAGEVTERGALLKDAEKERDAVRGIEDYDFFGLDGASCTDKDIERAYRKKSTQLHPDKGGDEKSFNTMREKYEQLKALRTENKRKEGGGSIKWDPNSRQSMLEAHSHLREQLVWITKHLAEVQHQLDLLRQRLRARHVLTWDEEQECYGPA